MAGFQVRAYPRPARGPGRRARQACRAPRFRLWSTLCHSRLSRPGRERANGPGKTPGRSGEVTSVDQKSMSPPPPGVAGAFFFSGFSAITASVVRNRPAIDAAFCSADRVTFAGSMMPALNMST